MAQHHGTDVSRMERMLANHCLEGLVFEKRQRKQAVHTLPVRPQNKPKKKSVKKSVQQGRGSDVGKKRIGRPPTIKKEQLCDKKMGKKVERESKGKDGSGNKPEGVAGQNHSRFSSSQAGSSKPRKRVKISHPISQKSKIGTKKTVLSENPPQKLTNSKEKRQKPCHQSDFQEVEPQQAIKPPPNDFQDSPGQAQSKEQNQPNPHFQTVKPEADYVKQKDDLQDEESQQCKDGNQSEDSDKLQMNSRGRVIRHRKTKGEALKRFSLFEQISQEQNESYYNENHRRRRHVVSTQKNYQINRIFRKKRKIVMPSFNLNTNIFEFNATDFVGKFGEFDLIHFSLPIQMLIRLPHITKIIPKGFIFIWAEKGEIPLGYHLMNRWGFDVIDQIMWIKTKEAMNQLSYDEDTLHDLFPNCRSTCLVGYKCLLSQKTEYCTKISNNVIFSRAKPGSIEKPDEIYQIADLMMPGAKKLNIGAKSMGGWMCLTHFEKSLYRCATCLSRVEKVESYLECKQQPESVRRVVCKKCLIVQWKKQNRVKYQEIYFSLLKEIEDFPPQVAGESENKQIARQTGKKTEISLETEIAEKLNKGIFELIKCKELNNKCLIRIKGTKCVLEKQLHCNRCKNPTQGPCLTGLIKCDFITQENTSDTYHLCLSCSQEHLQQISKTEESPAIEVSYNAETFFATKRIECSVCKKQELKKQYFECSTCKIQHFVCSQCFWSPPSLQSNLHETHEWKYRPIFELPETKFSSCFFCNEQCMMPCWACEICQNVFWCGYCDKLSPCTRKRYENYAHYNGSEHLMYLIV